MSLISCSILVSQQVQFLLISKALYKSLQIDIKNPIYVRLGSKTVKIQAKVSGMSGKKLAMPTHIAIALKLPVSGKCSIKSIPGGIQIGPLIGVLTDDVNFESQAGPRSAYIRRFIRTNTSKALYVVFSPHNVNWQEQTITGYVPRENGGWMRKTVPLPDVVYNRFLNRKLEKSEKMEAFKEKFVHLQIPIFNWNFFDKSDVYKLLEDNHEAAAHVPESHQNPSAETIRRLLEKYRFVYFKPSGGSMGLGIYRLTYKPGSGYFARFRRNGNNVLLRFSTFDRMMQALRKQSKFHNYVVQQGIRLIEIDLCPIDFRFHMTKNGFNQWEVSGIGAKKAGRGSVTTHISNGGQLLTPEQVLRNAFGHRAEDVLHKAKSVAVLMASAIESKYPHTLAELGLDVGIDRDENVWMFEANAKPGRSIFNHPQLRTQGKDTITNLVDHCLYLSRFSGGNTH